MLSLAKIGRGREDYHLRAVGADATQYYSERGEVAGIWYGGGAATLGLAGRVEDDALLAVLGGYQPGAQRLDTGWIGLRLVAPPRAGRRMPGIDACFKAPKSVSLLWAFGDRIAVGERTLDQVVEAAHDEAVREALAYLESSAARGRRHFNGVVQVNSSGFVAAAFRQRTSRADDPHLHTHVLIANLCHGDDGRWGALDARLIYAHARAAGYLYEAHLRHRLSTDLGVDWTAVENGIADVAGVPAELIDIFSKRRQEIRSRLEEVTQEVNEERARLGLAPVEARSQEALDIAARQTRATKLQHVATADLRAAWRDEAVSAGFEPEHLADVLHRAESEPPITPDGELHQRIATRLTENASTFGHRDAVQEMAADARRGLPVALALERAEVILGSDDVIPVVGAIRDQDVIRRSDGVVAPIPTGERRWSTPSMLAVEERIVASALGRQADGVAVVPPTVLRQALDIVLLGLPSLGSDQIEMASRLASSGAGVECVEAAPGTGKTTALGMYVAACRRAGIAVTGCAPSARARDELGRGAHIDRCFTMDKLLMELADSPLEHGSVLIVDEASMAGSRKLARLLNHAATSEAKMVLVGDTKQLSSVDAGGGFRGLVARLGAHQLTENRRQVHEWERRALQDLRAGEVRSAMTAYDAHGRLHLGEHDDLLERIVGAWWAARSKGESVMQASNWRDVLNLNERARERLVEAGIVEGDSIDVRGVTVGVGDHVMVLKNERALGVINGTMGVLTAIDHEGGDIFMDTIEPAPRSVRIPASFWNAGNRRRVTLAYCRTIHKAQGATYRGSSFTLAGDETIHLEAVHVALSRGTEANHLFYSGELPPDEDHYGAEVTEPAVERLIAAASRSRAQIMALDLLQGMATMPVRLEATAGEWTNAPVTSAQLAVLNRCGVHPPGDLTWVQASLLIDDAVGTPHAEAAQGWLVENGASQEDAASIVRRADEELARLRQQQRRQQRAARMPSGNPLSTAVLGAKRAPPTRRIAP